MGFGSTGQRGTPNILSKSANAMYQQTHPIFPPAAYSVMPPVVDDAAVRRQESIQRSRMLQKDLDDARIRAVSHEIGVPSALNFYMQQPLFTHSVFLLLPNSAVFFKFLGITLPDGPLGNDYKITRVAASTGE